MSHARTILTRNSELLWKGLNGVFAVYKPAGLTVAKIKKVIAHNLCKDLNELNVREKANYVDIVGETDKELRVVVRPNLADDIQFVGPRYQMSDVKLATANTMPRESAGVLLFGIKQGIRQVRQIASCSPTKSFKISGKLGIATADGFVNSKIMEQTTFKHINRYHIDKLCASLQSSHQKSMFELCGVDIQSQTAYELAKQGLIRPADKNIPVIYSIKCTKYIPPHFDLEIVCINEDIDYLKRLIDEIGILLKSSATCTNIQCFQFALFNSEIALLTKHWNLEYILNNIQICRNIIENNPSLLHQKSPHLVEEVKQ